MTIVPTIDCVRNFSTRINRNTYLQRNKYLSGYILYHSLEGDIINGWEYKDGKITGKVISPLLVKELDIANKKPLQLGKINSSYTVELKVDVQSRVASRSGEIDEGWDWDLGELPEVVVTPETGSDDDDWDIDDGSDWDDIWDDWQAPDTGDDSGDDDAPVVVPDDGSGSSGGISGGVDEEVPEEYSKLPKYDNMSSSFQVVANMESSDVYKLIGGLVFENYKSNPEGFANACALRLSYAFNWCGEDCKIPYVADKTGSGDADGNNVKEWYFYRVSDMANYLNDTYGNYEEVLKENIMGKQGIIGFSDCNFSNASGHLDIWDGEKCLDGDYSSNCETIYFWEFK